MSFGNLEWLFPSVIALHNLEEAIWLPEWSRQAGRWGYFFEVPRSSSRLHSSASGLQRIAPRPQRRRHPVGKDDFLIQSSSELLWRS
jgi:hypothetical protein